MRIKNYLVKADIMVDYQSIFTHPVNQNIFQIDNM